MIHLVNPLWNAFGGSERRTLDLFDLLRPHADVLLWSEHRVHPAVDRPVRRIGPDGFPRGGTLVQVGVYFPLGPWLAEARPERVILVLNTWDPPNFARALAAFGDRRPELVYASEALRRAVGRDGVVEPSPIDLRRFTPGPARPPGPLVVGRLSRDIPQKHHPGDPALYRRLTDQGLRVRVMGGTCLPEIPGVERLAEGAEPAVDFLRSLDVFFYRTSEALIEAFGRVVVEAMACGLPVVAHRRGGYAPLLKDGLPFDTEAEAVDLLLGLRDPGRRASIGAAARRGVEALYGPAWRDRTVAFYAKA